MVRQVTETARERKEGRRGRQKEACYWKRWLWEAETETGRRVKRRKVGGGG